MDASWTITQRSPSGTVVTQEFDRLGRRIRMSDGSGVVRYEYDGLGRLASFQREDLPNVVFSYDSRNRITGVWVTDEAALGSVGEVARRSMCAARIQQRGHAARVAAQ